jgi:3-oxoacyl-[acyl-carrier protein] reductase
MKTALITGSSRGIGKQIGIDLLDKDYFVYFNGRKSVPISTKLDWTFIEADMSKIESVEQINNLLGEQHTLLDVLVLNAGMTDRTPFGLVDWNNWNNVFSINLTVPFFLVQALKERIKPGGKVIFISSISGCTTDSTSIAYGVSKGALHILVPYLAKEFAPLHITVNAIAPGYINTNWHVGKSKEQIERISKKCLANRFGTPEEISKAAIFIIDNDFINGQIIRVDGGFGLC